MAMIQQSGEPTSVNHCFDPCFSWLYTLSPAEMQLETIGRKETLWKSRWRDV